jgi:hypothetical protein
MAAAFDTLRPDRRPRLPKAEADLRLRAPNAIPHLRLRAGAPKAIFLTRLASFFMAALTFLIQAFLRTAIDLYTRLLPRFMVAFTRYFLQILSSLDGGLAILELLRPLRLTLRRVLRFFPKPKRDNILILLSEKIIFKRIKLKLIKKISG